uniref:Claudin 4 n=1 Tax=Denticeps clupeoides TaxID=299321 RepID=A0AAY4D789_9TELE
MVSAGLQMLGTALALLGWIGVIVVCALPMWKVTAFIGENIVTSQTTWEGIWMSCVVQSTGQMQCKVYDSMLALSSDLQAARALTVISILVGIFGLMLALAGGKCTNSVCGDGTFIEGDLAGSGFEPVILLIIPYPERLTISTFTFTAFGRRPYPERLTTCFQVTIDEEINSGSLGPQLLIHLFYSLCCRFCTQSSTTRKLQFNLNIL